MKKIIYKIATLLFLFFVTQVNANQINQINFIGIDFTSEDFLQEIIPFKIGNEFTAIDSQIIIEDLFKTGFFSDITISTEGDQLNITLIENPFIKFIDFKNKGDTGLSAWLKNEQFYLTEESINALADENNLSPGNIFNKTRFEEFILHLKSKYTQAGYFNVEIESGTSTDLQNRIGIDISIEQGNQARVDEINIVGNNVFESKEILKLFEIGKPNNFFINYFTNKDLFTEDELQSGLDLLTQKYFDSGYLDFKILGLETDLSDNNEKISITIDITEGIQYKVGNISFQGEIGNLTSSFLQDSFKIKSGDVFNRQIVISDIQTITDLYADQGYAFVNINPITSDFLDTVNITIDISLNKKVYINRINISGNTRTLDEVIRREIGISEGGLYSRSILRESIMSLRRLGYFSNVEIEANDIPGVSDKIDLFVKVEETKTGAVNFSVSHSNTYGISFGAGIKEKNIFGSGNTLNAEFKLSESFNRLSFYFEDPNYNDQGHSINYGVFASEIKDDDIMQDSYEIDTKGLSFGYGIPLTKNTRLNTSLEYSKNEIKCGSSFASANYESKQCLDKNNDELKLGVNWSESTLNDFMYPTDGKSNSIDFGIALPIGDFEYYNFNASHQSYEPLNDNLTLKLSGSLGLASGYGGKELPFYKRYFGGGSGSIRGFGNKSLGPLYPNKKSKGGELSILGSANIISPALFFDDNENMRMSAFIDTGNIYDKSSDISLDDLRMSSGIGFAYLSPIGAIGMYWSVPILKKSGDIIENFGFSLGTGF
jgi:outer membrane protein insertion porin family